MKKRQWKRRAKEARETAKALERYARKLEHLVATRDGQIDELSARLEGQEQDGGPTRTDLLVSIEPLERRIALQAEEIRKREAYIAELQDAFGKVLGYLEGLDEARLDRGWWEQRYEHDAPDCRELRELVEKMSVAR